MKIYLKLFTLGLLLLSPKVFAQNASLSLSGANHDINLPVEITANNLSINQSSTLQYSKELLMLAKVHYA